MISRLPSDQILRCGKNVGLANHFNKVWPSGCSGHYRSGFQGGGLPLQQKKLNLAQVLAAAADITRQAK